MNWNAPHTYSLRHRNTPKVFPVTTIFRCRCRILERLGRKCDSLATLSGLSPCVSGLRESLIAGQLAQRIDDGSFHLDDGSFHPLTS